ncbi:MAG: OmpH family outer membrane protein [Verrucomicrobia bacterium]|nr:OmpH family outer membrane protein [Verrucomicrobiota bacterium]
MKKMFARIAAALAAVTLLAAPVRAAELKIATVNLKKAFDEYWKTKVADKQLKDDATSFEKRYKDMVEDYKKANEDYRKLLDGSADPAVSADERDKRKKAAENKLREVQEIENSIKTFERSANSQIMEKKRNMRDKIVTEIRGYVDAKAKAGSFAAVIDSSSESINNAPILLYTAGLPDLTEELLTQLNATAPPGALDALNGKNGEKKEDKK